MFLNISNQDGIAVVTLSRGKVNAINDEVVAELSDALKSLVRDKTVKALVLTGNGKFFSFGLDVPELYNYSPKKMTAFITIFSKLCRDLFLFPRPVVAAVNGHATAGGCLLALTAEYRLLANTNAKMSLHEVSFGASLFPSAVEMLRYAVGNTHAEVILLSGKMFEPAEALGLGLVNELVEESKLLDTARLKAQKLAHNFSPAFTSLKRLVRQPIVDQWSKREKKSIDEWIEIWYSPKTREKIKQIKIF